ncbi:MAG: ferrous iron transport protein A [Campylobacterales bacterium]|nr:ferrous iron transport protein A [Campylobacterales bacterium]
MSIFDMDIGERGKIIDIHAKSDLKLRLQSLGLNRDVDIEVRAFALRKKNVELLVDDTLVALREEEMKMIEVSKA